MNAATTLLQARASSAGLARRFVCATLLSWQADALIDIAQLLTSELVTNAVIHAGTDIELQLEQTSQGIRCEVTDHGAGTPVARLAKPEELGGRGLHLVDAMSKCWGVRRSPGAKAVWFELTNA
ncbi:MAG TPA: ATP-binding protein [Acidimicrobiales bacterium]